MVRPPVLPVDTKNHALEACLYIFNSILSMQANGMLYARPRTWLAVKVFNMMFSRIPSNNITSPSAVYYYCVQKLCILTRPDSNQRLGCTRTVISYCKVKAYIPGLPTELQVNDCDHSGRLLSIQVLNCGTRAYIIHLLPAPVISNHCITTVI